LFPSSISYLYTESLSVAPYFWASGRGYLSNLTIPIYRECFYGESFLGQFIFLVDQFQKILDKPKIICYLLNDIQGRHKVCARKRTKAFKRTPFFVVLFISVSENLKGMFLRLARFS